MTETVAPEAPAFEIPADVKPIVDVWRNKATAANSLALQIKDAKSGADSRVQKVLTESEDEEIAAWRVWDEKAAAKVAEILAQREANLVKIKERAGTFVDTVTFDVDSVQKEFLTLRQEITSLRNTVRLLTGGDDSTLEKIAESAGIMEVTNVRHGTSGATSGATGKRKPRLESAMIGDKSYEKPSFTTLSKDLAIDIDVLKAAAFKAAETDDLSTKVGQSITFTVVNGKGENVSVTVVPRSDAKAKDETPAVVETPEVPAE